MAKSLEERAYDRACTLCLRFPGAEVKLSHGAPSFHVKGKLFVMFNRGGYNEPKPSLWIKSTHDEQRTLVAQDPARYFVPPYVGVSGWVGARLDDDLGPAGPNDVDLAILIENAWTAIAPQSFLSGKAPAPAAKTKKAKPVLALPQTDAKAATAALERFRAMVAKLPDVEVEQNGIRDATIRTNGKPFAYFLNNHHGDEIISACVRRPLPEITALTKADPKRFYLPQYIGKRGWLGVRLDAKKVDWKDLARRLADSYAAVAPSKRVVAKTTRKKTTGTS